MRVIIVPATSGAEAVKASLMRWSISGLLEPFIWWSLRPGDPATKPVVRIDAGAEEVLPLARAFGGAETSDVALVAFAPITGEDDPDGEFVRVVERAVEQAQLVVAFEIERAFEATMVVAPAGVGQPVPALFRAQWLANVYVAPEDRVDPRDFNHLQGDPGAFPRHAAHALATIADLWVGAPEAESVLQRLIDRQPAQAPAPVQVVRCFSRILEYGYLPDHLAAGVFRPGAEWPNPDPDRFDRVHDAAGLLPPVVRAYYEQHGAVLGLSPFEPIPLPPVTPIGIWKALALLFRLLLERIKDMPMQVVEKTLASIHDRAAERIEGLAGSGEGMVVQRWRQRPPGKPPSLSVLHEHLQQPLHVSDGPVAPAWTDLQRIGLGLVDGAPLPLDLDSRVLARGPKRALVTDPQLIVPDPQRPPLPTPEDPSPRGCDPLRDLRHAERKKLRADAADPGEGTLDPAGRPFVWQVGHRLAGALRTAESFERKQEADSLRVAVAGGSMREAIAASRAALRRRVAILTTAAALAGVVVWVVLEEWLHRAPALAVVVLIWIYTLASAARAAYVREQRVERETLERQLGELNDRMLQAQRRGDAIRLRRRYQEYLDWAEILGWLVHHPWVGDPLKRLQIRGLLPADSIPAALQVGVAQQTPRHLEQLSSQARAGLYRSAWLGGLYTTVEALAMEDAVLTRVSSSLAGKRERPDPAGDVSEDPESPRRLLVSAIRKGRGRHLRNHPLATDLLQFVDDKGLDDLARNVAIMKADSEEQHLAPLPPAVAYFDAPTELQGTARSVGGAVLGLVRGTEVVGGVVIDGRVLTVATAVAGPEPLEAVVQGGGRIPLQLEKTHDGLAVLSPRPPEPVPEAQEVPEEDAGDAKEETKETEADEGAEVKLIKPERPRGRKKKSESTPPPPSPPPAPPVVAELPPSVSAAVSWLETGDAVVVVGPGGPSWGLVTATDPEEFTCTVAYGAPPPPEGSPVFDLHARLVGLQVGRPEPARRRGGDPPAQLKVADLRAVQAALGLTAGSAPTAVSASLLSSEDATQRPSPSAFLDEPHREARGVALLPQHWRSNSRDRNLIDDVVPTAPDVREASGTVGRFSVGARFLHPLRILVHRVDLTVPVPPDELASCEPADDSPQAPSPARDVPPRTGIPGGLGDATGG